MQSLHPCPLSAPLPAEEKADTEEEDEAMETEEPTTTSNTDGDGGSEYCPSSCRDSEETSTEASVIDSQVIPEKQSQKSGDK